MAIAADATRCDPNKLGIRIAELRDACDNSTNFAYIARIYAVIIVSISAAIAFFNFQGANGLSFWWNVPVALAVIVIVGASQHQLGGATHEATHFILFRNRTLNELVSDWACMFPLYSTTYQFRLYHLAHHQFINDPVRDPDIAMLRDSGHELDFPLAHLDFVKALVKQLWLPNLVRYSLTRLRYNGLGADDSPYRGARRPGWPWPTIVIAGYTVALPIALFLAKPVLGIWVLVTLFSVLGALALAYLALVPDDRFLKFHIRPVISHRATALSRIAYYSVLYTGMSLLEANGLGPVWFYFFLFWATPVFTAFPIFMIMRQWVQHGNADRGRLTNTRVFLVNPLVRYAVFPFGMDYHLPHHMYASVPHYKLPELHQALTRADAAYSRDGVVVEGYFNSPAGSAGNPTVLQVLGPSYARHGNSVHIDSDALSGAEVNDIEAIRREERSSAIVSGA